MKDISLCYLRNGKTSERLWPKLDTSWLGILIPIKSHPSPTPISSPPPDQLGDSCWRTRQPDRPASGHGGHARRSCVACKPSHPPPPPICSLFHGGRLEGRPDSTGRLGDGPTRQGRRGGSFSSVSPSLDATDEPMVIDFKLAEERVVSENNEATTGGGRRRFRLFSAVMVAHVVKMPVQCAVVGLAHRRSSQVGGRKVLCSCCS